MKDDKVVVKTAGIHIEVGLNSQQTPVRMTWTAEDTPGGSAPQEMKAVLMSFFEKETLETMKIDLWTNELLTMEMDKFMYYTLRALSDTYLRATNNKELAEDMQRFSQYFGEQTEILPRTA